MDSLEVEIVVLLGVVTEVFNACEGSGESLGSGLQVASEGAKIGDLPSEKLIGAVEVSGFFGSGLKVVVVHAANGPVLDVCDGGVVLVKSKVDSVESSCIVDEISSDGISELSKSGKDVVTSLTSNVGALVTVSLVAVVASARLGTVSVVGAGGVGGAWAGGGTDIIPAEVGSVDVSAEVEAGVALAREVVSFVGASRVSLAWVAGARVNPAVNSVTVETIVASARPHGGTVNVWEFDTAGGVGGAVVRAAAGVWDA